MLLGKTIGAVALIAGCTAIGCNPVRPAVASTPSGSDDLRDPAAFAGIRDTSERSRALFLEASRVLLHPRCTNCHPDGDSPYQGIPPQLHDPPVTRGPDGLGGKLGCGPRGNPKRSSSGAAVAPLLTLREMDLNLVRTFARVVEAQSFTAAARVLRVPKSSVSRAVARLEEQLGARLFERTTRQVRLTHTGQAYYHGAARALAALEDAEQSVLENQGEPRGTVRLTVPVGAPRAFLSDMVTRFVQQYPLIRVEVSFSDRPVDLVAEGFDLALRGSANGRLQGSSLIARKVAQVSLWLLASPSYLERRGEPRRAEDLKNHDLIVYSGGGLSTRTWPLKGPHGLEPIEVTGVLASDDSTFIRELILQGAGIGLCVARLEDLDTGVLVRVLPGHEVPDLSLSVVMPSNRHLPRRVALLRDALIAGFKGFGSFSVPHSEMQARVKASVG